jgi:histone H3/H4
MELTRPSLTRLSRKAGIKSLSEECYPYIRALIVQRATDIIKNSLIINQQHQTKTLMDSDVYEALALFNENMTQSNDLGTTTLQK